MNNRNLNLGNWYLQQFTKLSRNFNMVPVESVSESTYFDTLILLCLKDMCMSSIYKNGNKWYYQNSLDIDGRKERFQRYLGTDDKDVATKLQMHYDYVIAYEKRNSFIGKRVYPSQMITDYLEYREKQEKRRLIVPRTLDSDKGALLNSRGRIGSVF